MKTTELKKFCKKANKLKCTQPVANNYILLSGGQIVRSDFWRYIVLNVPELDQNLNCLIDFKAFKKIVDRAKTIDIVPGNKDLETKIQTEKGTYTLTQKSYTEDYPDFPVKDLKTLDSLDSQETKNVKKAVDYTVKDELRPVMETVLVDTDHIVATDAHRLIYNKRPKTGKQKFLVDKVIASLLEDKEHDVAIDKSQEWIKIFEENYEYWYYQVDAYYPQWRSVIPDTSESKAKTKVNAKELKSALEEAEPALPEQFSRVAFYNNTDYNKLNLAAKNLETNIAYNTNIDAKCKGEKMFIGLRQKLLLSIIKTEKYETMEFKLFDPDRAMIINDEVLLMPVQIEPEDFEQIELAEKEKTEGQIS